MTAEPGKVEIRITGFPENDDLVRRVEAYAKKKGLRMATAARMLLKAALDAEKVK